MLMLLSYRNFKFLNLLVSICSFGKASVNCIAGISRANFHKLSKTHLVAGNFKCYCSISNYISHLLLCIELIQGCVFYQQYILTVFL